MSVATNLLRQTAVGAGRGAGRELRLAMQQGRGGGNRRARVDPHWRRSEDGGAARLTPHELIAPGRPVGRWHGVDPHRPYDTWRAVGKFIGLLGWAGVVGGAWWLGSSHGRGPLAAVSELDRFGEAVGAALDGFSELQ
jgi:hypothetical protein